MFVCTARSSPNCRGRWGRTDLPLEPGGACYACQSLEPAGEPGMPLALRAAVFLFDGVARMARGVSSRA